MPNPTIRALGWMVTLAAIAIYIFMLSVSLPHLAEMAGGMPMFDMRAGYDLDTARTILERLGEDGRRYYADVQHALDSFYPPLMALAVSYWMWRAAPRWRGAGLPLSNLVLVLLTIIAACSAVFDLTENGLVGRMLTAGPDAVTAETVGLASGFTLAKTVAVTISLSALSVLGIGPSLARLFGRKG